MKTEKEIRQQIEADNAKMEFKKKLKVLETKIDELAEKAVDAEDCGDMELFEATAEALYSVEQDLKQMKRFDLDLSIALIKADIGVVMADAMMSLSKLSGQSQALPSIKKVLKAQQTAQMQLTKISSSQQVMSGAMKNINPASNVVMSENEKKAVRARIDAQRIKMGRSLVGAGSIVSDLQMEIDEEKSKKVY